jgi:hypothetical protein
MARGIFPKMLPSEIVGYLSNWDINITQEQLLRPTPEVVESVYYACLEQVTSISFLSIKAPVQTALARLDDSDQVRALSSISTLSHFTSGFVLCCTCTQHPPTPSVCLPPSYPRNH